MNNQKWLKPLRVSIAIIFILAFLVLFSDTKARIPAGVYNFFTGFQFLPSLLKFPVLPSVITGIFIGIIILTLVGGRVYCSVFCPLGILQDVMSFFQRKVPFLRKKPRYTKPLHVFRYSVLAIFLISLVFLGIIALNILDPYSNFGRMASNIYQPVFIGVNNLLARVLSFFGIHIIHSLEHNLFAPLAFFVSVGMFLLILVMVLFRDRLYCNTICPVGTFLGLLSRVSFFKIKINEGSCTQCGKCQLVCKSNCIDVKNLHVDISRCVQCYNCISVCNDDAVGYIGMKKDTATEKQTSSSKRDFFKAGLLFMGGAPILAHANGEGHGKRGHKNCFWSRGPISPPGSISIDHMKDKCVACELCVASCPTNVLQPSFLEYGFTSMMVPHMNNRAGYCNYECTHCGDVCPTGAIIPLSKADKETTQIGTVEFRKHLCIVHSEGTACGSCSEHCPTQAVYMVPYKGDLTIPEVNPDICVGCGACEYACPVEDPHVAIFVEPHKVHRVAQKPVIEALELDETEEDFPF